MSQQQYWQINTYTSNQQYDKANARAAFARRADRKKKGIKVLPVGVW